MILFENVTKKYRGTKRPALDGVNLKIERGEFVFIVGASGSGKSSTLRLMLREEQPTEGQIHVLGLDLGKISNRKVPYFRRNLGVVFQDFRLLSNKTVYDNVAFSLQVIGKSRGYIQEAVPDVLNMVGLAGKEKRFPHELSGGEQQRVAIARAIVNKPAVLLADEPTGNLDPATSLGIMQLLRAINASGTTVVMATHEATFVDIMQQRVIEISEGVIVRDEQQGGYGQTASIPLADLAQAHGSTIANQTSAQVSPTSTAQIAAHILAPQNVAQQSAEPGSAEFQFAELHDAELHDAAKPQPGKHDVVMPGVTDQGTAQDTVHSLAEITLDRTDLDRPALNRTVLDSDGPGAAVPVLPRASNTVIPDNDELLAVQHFSQEHHSVDSLNEELHVQLSDTAEQHIPVHAENPEVFTTEIPVVEVGQAAELNPAAHHVPVQQDSEVFAPDIQNPLVEAPKPVLSEGAVVAGWPEQDDLDRTVRAVRPAQTTETQRRIPAFLEQAPSANTTEIDVTGEQSIAESLGLRPTDDNQDDVGPVR